jgi:hypothetical protein
MQEELRDGDHPHPEGPTQPGTFEFLDREFKGEFGVV